MKNYSTPAIGAVSLSLLMSGCETTTRVNKEEQPNVVIIFLDDAGWADFDPFWKNYYKTENVNALAREGRVFQNFYVPQAVCSASRSALLTGCYPGRTDMHGAHGPNHRGVDPSFETIGEMLKRNDYTTGAFGKWHIGDAEETRPPARGFDESAGIMYSNDMWSAHPVNPDYWGQFPLRYWENGEVIIDSVTGEHQKYFTKWITESAVDFIDRNKENPFFLYVAHPQPHVPLFCSDEFKGKSGIGLFADVMLEIDWSVGQIMQSLKKNGLEDNTLVMFSSDNGPWISYGNHAGKTPFRNAKTSSFDGGIRSPLIMKLPGKIPSGSVSRNCLFSIDILPTIAEITHAQLPQNQIDGKNVWELIVGEDGVDNPHDYYAVSLNRKLQAVLSSDGKWKLHLPHGYSEVVEGGNNGMPGKRMNMEIDTALFNLVNDPYEISNLHGHYPEITNQLLEYAQKHKNVFYLSDD